MSVKENGTGWVTWGMKGGRRGARGESGEREVRHSDKGGERKRGKIIAESKISLSWNDFTGLLLIFHIWSISCL